MLVQRLPDALRDATMLMAVDDHRVQHLAEIGRPSHNARP